jgi:hypothetical protein
LMDSEDQPLLLPIYMAHYLLMLMDYRDSGSGARDSGLGVRGLTIVCWELDPWELGVEV